MKCSPYPPELSTRGILKLCCVHPTKEIWCHVSEIANAIHMTEEDVIWAMEAGNLWIQKRKQSEYWTSVQALYDAKSRHRILPPVLNMSYLMS